MKTIDKDANQYYLSRIELTCMTFGSKRDESGNHSWLDKFDKGDILHINEGNGKTTVMIVQEVKQLVSLT